MIHKTKKKGKTGMQKKILALILGMVSAVAVAGCGGASDTYTDLNPELQSEIETLGDYKNLTYTWEEVAVTDEEVEEEIGYELEWYAEYEEITDRTVAENGDVVNIDFVGKIDGEEFEDGSGEEYDLELGSGEFIEGFEEQIVGKEVGSQFDVNVTFPEDYNETLGGKAAVFQVTLNKIQKSIPAELTDEFVVENLEYASVSEYKAAVKEDLLSSKELENKDNAVSELMDQILSNSEFAIEESDIDKLVEEQISGYEMYASMYEMDLDQFVEQFFGCTVDELRESSREEVESEIKSDLVFSEIARKEKLGITQEAYEEAVTAELEDYECETIEEFEEQFGKEDYIYTMLHDKVTEYLLSQSQKQ